MLPFEKLANTWDQLQERVKPHLRPTERQRQLKREDDLRSRKLGRAIGEWRVWVIGGWMGLIGSMSVPNAVTTKPMIVLTALAFVGFGFYKRYFPSEPPAEELSSEPRPSADATPPLEHEATVARASDPKRRVTRE